MKLIWVLLLLTATVAFVRADEEEQELVDADDTVLDEMEEITDDEQGDEELEDPKRLRCRRRRRRGPHVCKIATIRCLKAVKKSSKIAKIAREIKCKRELGCIARGIRCGYCMHKRHRPRPNRRPRPSRRPRPTRPRRHGRCRKLFKLKLKACGKVGKKCLMGRKKSYCRKLRCVKKVMRCMKLKGGKPRKHDEILEDVEDEELAEMPEEFSVAEGIEEDEEEMDPGRGKSKIKKACKVVGLFCFRRGRIPKPLRKRICKRKAVKCVKCLSGWGRPFRKPRKGKQ